MQDRKQRVLPLYKRPLDIVYLCCMVYTISNSILTSPEPFAVPNPGPPLAGEYPTWPPRSVIDGMLWWSQFDLPVYRKEIYWKVICAFDMSFALIFYLFSSLAFIYGWESVKPFGVMYASVQLFILTVVASDNLFGTPPSANIWVWLLAVFPYFVLSFILFWKYFCKKSYFDVEKHKFS